MQKDRTIYPPRASVILGVIATLMLAALGFLSQRRKTGAGVDSANVAVAPPSPPPSAKSGTTNRHVLPAGQIISRAICAGGIAAGALLMLATVLVTAQGKFDAFQVSTVTLASAAIAFSPTMLHRCKNDLFFFLFLVTGLLPLWAAYLVLQQQDSLNRTIVIVTIAAVVAAISTAVVETTKFGEWVWMWKESSWEWTIFPKLGRKRGSSSNAAASTARTP